MIAWKVRAVISMHPTPPLHRASSASARQLAKYDEYRRMMPCSGVSWHNEVRRRASGVRSSAMAGRFEGHSFERVGCSWRRSMFWKAGKQRPPYCKAPTFVSNQTQSRPDVPTFHSWSDCRHTLIR